MKTANNFKVLSLIVVFLTVTVAASFAAEKPRVLVLAWNDPVTTLTALRAVGLDAVQAPQMSSTTTDLPGLNDARLVVVTADAVLPDEVAAKIAAFVRNGGGMLVVHTASDAPNYWWTTYRRPSAGFPHPSPLWDALPFVSVGMSEKGGISNPFGPTRIQGQLESPLLEGVDLKQAPIFPFHTLMILPTNPLVQNSHVMFAWSDDQYKSPLWGNGQVLAWGDDPEQRPLLISAQYGAGRCIGAAVPLFDKGFLQWPGSQVLIKNLTAALVGTTAPAATAPHTVYGVGLSPIVSDSLHRMGLDVSDQAKDASGAIVYGVPTAEQAQALAQMAQAKLPVVVANPAALLIAPLNGLVTLGKGAETPAPNANAAPTPHTSVDLGAKNKRRNAPAIAPNANAASAVNATVDPKPVWTEQNTVIEPGWALDPQNVGQKNGWFTEKGSAAIKWQDATADAGTIAKPERKTREPRDKKPRAGAPAGQDNDNEVEAGVLQGPPATATDATKSMLSWGSTYRWRLEGNLLDRRDLIEGWELPTYNDSTWAEQTFDQAPPPPKVAGVTAPSQSLMAGAIWTRAKMKLTHPETSRGWLTPSATSKFVTFLDGKPLKEPVALRTLAAGEHSVALRIWPLQHGGGNLSANPWGSGGPETLEWPEIVESPWLHHDADTGEADGFFADYHADWLSGDPTEENLHQESSGWYQARINAQPTNMPLAISKPEDSLADTLVWLDGKKLGAAPQVIDIPQLKPGVHIVTLLKENTGPITVYSHANVWLKATVRLPADTNWNAIKMDKTANVVMYVNGQQVALREPGILLVPWKAGDNLLVFGNLDKQQFPAMHLAQTLATAAATGEPDATRLAGVWYMRNDPDHQALIQGWPAALKEVAPPAGWAPIAPDTKNGVIATVPDERPVWFAAPFQATAAEAKGPARMVLDTTGDGAPVDLIKNIWVNGQRVPAQIEFASTQRYDMDRGKQTTISFVLTGHLKAGCNWVAFPADFQEYYRMRMAMPSTNGRWPVPLPKLDFSGKLDAITWSEPFTKLNASGLVHREQVVAPPTDATVLARFSDGAPAVARVGNITFATSDQSQDWSEWIEEAIRYDWVVQKDGRSTEGAGTQAGHRNHASGDPVQADGAQIAASLLRGAPAILGVEPAADGGTPVLLAASKEPRILSYQFRNWMGMVLSEGRLEVPAGATHVAAPAPTDDPSPMTTNLRGDRWLRVALLDNGGASVRDYLETRVDVPPAVEVLLSPTDGSQRDLPATVPGSTGYDPFNTKWSLMAEAPPEPVIVLGERIVLRAMCRNTTAQPQQVALKLTWDSALGDKPVALQTFKFTLSPYEQRTELLPCGFRVSDMQFTVLPDNDPAPLRTLAPGASAEGNLTTGRIVARSGDAAVSELALVAVRPWKEFAANSTRPLKGQWGAPAGFDMSQFDKTASLETLLDPKPHRWWGGQVGGYWDSADDFWRDSFINTTGSGGGFGGFLGKEAFAWGPFDDIFDPNSVSALDNSDYMPNGTQYQEMLYAGLSREYNRAMNGTQPLTMGVADYWANFGLPMREKNIIQFLHWRRDQGRPLKISTQAELKEMVKDDSEDAEDGTDTPPEEQPAESNKTGPTVKDDWMKFNEQAHVAWSLQFMAGMPPGSINWSQGEVSHFLFGRLHDNLDAIRAVLRANNEVVMQPTNLNRRGELQYGCLRAMDPGLLLRNDFWYHTGTNSTTAGGVFGSSGLVMYTPEWGRLANLDYGQMAIRDDDGQIQPMLNVPFNHAYLPKGLQLFATKAGSLPAEVIGRDVTYHLGSLIQPERLLGDYVVTPLQRVALDKLDSPPPEGKTKPITSLTHMLRNYGAMWGGIAAPDRLDNIQPGEGALYLMPSGVTDAEAKQVVDLVQRGGNASVFFCTGGTKTHETPVSDLFGVKYAPPPLTQIAVEGTAVPAKTQGSLPSSVAVPPQYVATKPGNDVIQGSGDMANRVLLREVEAGKGRAMFSGLDCNTDWGEDHDLDRQLAKAVNWAAGNPVTLPDGVGGYAFEAKGMTFLVLENIKYTGGPAAIQIKLPAGNYAAADLFGGLSVKVEPRADGVTVYPVLPPNGGSMVVVRKIE